MATTNFVDQTTIIEADWCNDVDEHVYDQTTGLHTAANITNVPAGSIAATDIQAAINELDTEKEPADATILKDADIGVTVQAYDVDTMKADTTDNLSVGFTTDIYDYSTTASITIDFTQESIATWTPGAAATINEDAVNGLQVILCTPSATISLSAGSNVEFNNSFGGTLDSGVDYVLTVAKFGTDTKVVVSTFS